jgi:hypothetical protein
MCTPDMHADLTCKQLQTLPEELLQLVISRLGTADLKNVALASRLLHRHATDVLWHDVCLVDQWTLHPAKFHDDNEENDQHDDTPIIAKLYILATNPALAAKVQVITHRCHLPTPNIFNQLPGIHFDAVNLSQDVRLRTLLKLAVRNLVNLHTLRIIHGHWHLTNALITYLLDEQRPRHVPIRRLWLENCCLSGAVYRKLPSCLSGLESLRLRRLRGESVHVTEQRQISLHGFRLARGGSLFEIQNGAGGWITTTVQFSSDGPPGPNSQQLQEKAEAYDNAIWDNLVAAKDLVDHNPAERLPEPLTSIHPFKWFFQGCTTSGLTSLNLDWILWRQEENDPYEESTGVFTSLARSRFPHLRAFQVRNAVLPHTELPKDVYLLEDTLLDFMEAHPKIQCLAWPMDRFYRTSRSSVEVQTRCQKVVAHLAMMLTDVRVDTYYSYSGESWTDESSSVEEAQACHRRRRFIEEFIPHMRRVEQIKLEGGIPRDEKREVLRALHWCPLKKTVLIGTAFPVGNIWGHQGRELKELDEGLSHHVDFELDEEDRDGILKSYIRSSRVPEDFTFEPTFGWPSTEAPFLYTLALHHASTIEELKLCGYTGCPILSAQTSIAPHILAPLRQLTNLRQLVVSFWLLTWFEGAYRDKEIIQSWLDTRSPSSTALVVVTPPHSPTHEFPVDPAALPNFADAMPPRQEYNRWAVALKTRFTPSALAYRVARHIGPYLNEEAKKRPGGVRVRASFCLGDREGSSHANDIFDLDMRVGRNDAVLEFVGPREEGEKGRWRTKMEQRRWF